MLKKYLTKVIAAGAIVAASVAITAGCGEEQTPEGPETEYKMPATEEGEKGKDGKDPAATPEDMPGKEGTSNPTG